MFISNAIDPDIHQHHLVEIFISLNGSLKIKNDGNYYEAKNFIIDADVPHQVDSCNNAYAVLLVDSESAIAERLRKKFIRNGIGILPDDLFNPFHEKINFLFKKECSIEKALELHTEIIQHLIGNETDEISDMDPRIKKIIAILQQSYGKKISIKELSDKICLSESRLIHLFSKQVGIPIRRYLLWLRLLDAVNLIINDRSFTFAAHEAGFSDSAHLSRTFKKMFGLKLLEIFKIYKNSRFIQVRIMQN